MIPPVLLQNSKHLDMIRSISRETRLIACGYTGNVHPHCTIQEAIVHEAASAASDSLVGYLSKRRSLGRLLLVRHRVH